MKSHLGINSCALLSHSDRASLVRDMHRYERPRRMAVDGRHVACDVRAPLRPTIWVPDGVLDHLLARETALARPNMPSLDRFFVPSFP